MASTWGLHLQLSSPLAPMSTSQPPCPLTLQEGITMAGVKRREAKIFPWEESLLGSCQVRQKWKLIYPGWEQHAGQHREKRLKITWNHRQLKFKTLINVAMSPVRKISEYWNKMGPGANYMEIFLFAHFTARQNESIANVSPPLTGILSFLSFCYHNYLSQHAFCPSSY